MPFEPPTSFNIADYFLEERLREGRGERIALRTSSGNWTYNQVSELAARFGGVLRKLGVRQEERVLIALPDGPEYVGALFGILKIGAVVVMVNPALEPEKLAALFHSSRAAAAVVHSSALETFVQAQGEGTWPRSILSVDAEGGPFPRFQDEATGVASQLESVATHRDDPAIWLFSGGTTGLPKAVVQSHRSFANTTELYAKGALAYSEDAITLSVPKLYFGYATGSNLFFPFSVGASAILFEGKPTADALFDEIRRHRPTILINVPTVIQQMVSHPAVGEQDLSCLRCATSAGEALPVPLYHRWKETFNVELLDGLGTAEMWHVFLTNRPGDVSPGTLGKVVPGFEIKVCDDSGAEVDDGEVGRLWVAGESRALCYWQNQTKTQECFQGRWFTGGDLVCRAQDGTVTYCGRDDDMYKVGGKWFSPGEVESCLMRHEAVEECAVIAVETEAGLIKPYAFVRTQAPQDGLEEILKACVLEALAPYKHPRRVLFLEDFPRTHLGKIDRGKLRDLTEL